FVPTMLETEVDLKAAGYSFYYIDDRRWQLDALDTLAEPPVGVGPTDRENVLITTMSEQDVRAMFQRARADYEEAIQNIAAGQDDPLTAPLQP
ncbi:MAG TPA: hypothetical protein VFT07_05800, partial [Sphingomicrobium sp.]|nr:hypothetical protein [Sphingomicrobium sp.]